MEKARLVNKSGTASGKVLKEDLTLDQLADLSVKLHIEGINETIEKNEAFDKKTESNFPLVEKAREHWKEFQPTMFKALERAGMLERRLEEAAQKTVSEMADLRDQGFDDHEAREIVYPKYILLRDENEDQELAIGENPGLDAIHAGHVEMSKIKEEE